MSLEDGVFSLILECNLRNLGFIRIHNSVVANAGNMFVRPLGFNTVSNMEDTLHGFQYSEPKLMMKNFEEQRLWLPFASTAKLAIDNCLKI
tara:strand:+ start:273 stop:545 length:273 start_codon:yes stop_codon:yes gene_type:complete